MGKREIYRQANLHFLKGCLTNIYKEKLFENISYLQQDSKYHPYVQSCKDKVIAKLIIQYVVFEYYAKTYYWTIHNFTK